MKKVLFILHYPPPVHGAAMVGKYIRESNTINDSFGCSYINLGTSTSVDEIGKGGIRKWLRYVSILITTFKTIIKSKPNLVYITLTASGLGFYKDALVALLAKTLGRRVVYHFHNKGIKNHHDKFIDNILYKLVFKNSKVILLSRHLYNDIAKYVAEESVYFCANGIPENTTLEDLSIEPLTNKNFEILFLSNLLLAKGIYVLLDACKILKDKGLSFNCTLIGGQGDINPEELNDKIIDIGLENIVTYKGKKYNKDKELAFAKADVFVFPTFYHNETFGLVNLEAMQFSLPVISTREGGIPDVVGDGETGFLIQKKDPIALAAKIEILIRNPELRKQMGENGRLKYEQMFTLKIFEKRLCEILEKIA